MLTKFQLPLPRGISSGMSVPDVTKIGFDAFKDACEHAALLLRGKMENAYDAYARPHFSYHEAKLSYDFGRKSCSVLCSVYYPVIGFATVGSRRDSYELTFTDNAMLSTAIGEKLSGHVLSAEDANRGTTQEIIELLDEAEKKDVRYWKPRRVGDVIFNQWD